MNNLSKICDTADWFDNEFYSIIINELKEQPRFHRKQWEFVMIFLVLRKLGFLDNKKIGLSMGGGSERVLYSIANHVKKLFVTDLYDENTTWDCARTFNPDDFITQNKPFEVDDEKITALKMDMRLLEFDDNSFDFCYSSCAFEHIGGFDDFTQHLDEVYRCLKPNGVYVFTTELQLGETTIQDKNNYIFSPGILQLILDNAKLSLELNPDAILTDIVSNYPLPSNISNLCSSEENTITDIIMKDYPHTILLRGKYPFTSLQLVLRKKAEINKNTGLVFKEIDKTKTLAMKGVESYRNIVENSNLIISPFSSLPNKVSRFYQDHSDFFSINASSSDDTIFHTDYFWLGNGERTFQIDLEPDEMKPEMDNMIQIRIHRYATLDSENTECVFEKEIIVTKEKKIKELIPLETNDDYCYAILAKHVSGDFKLRSISIKSRIVNINEFDPVEIIHS
jgi:SAM-dependent methyltransferase